jgi:hypothetical protein
MKRDHPPATRQDSTHTTLTAWPSFNLFGDNNLATERAIALLRTTDRLGTRRRRELHTAVKAVSRDPQAANRLLVQLRPLGLLSGYGRLAVFGDVSAVFQHHLGQLLALGTRAGRHSVSANWKQEFVRLLDDGITVKLADGRTRLIPAAWLAAPLLEPGRFDQGLLSTVADVLLREQDSRWDDTPLPAPLSPAHPHYRPLSSLLHGLGDDPAGAAALLYPGGAAAPRLAALARRSDVDPLVWERTKTAAANLIGQPA